MSRNTNQRISTAIHKATYKALRLIQENQNDEGYFSDSPSIFSTSIILRCVHSLSSFDVTKSISEKGAQFLLAKKSKNWSWNYWINKDTSHCPDDLDDTFSVLSAISLYDEKIITGEAWAHISRILVLCETEVGGPYNTWIIPPNNKHKDQKVNWRDTDIVVNSNIAYFLKLKGVQMPALVRYTEKTIQDSIINGKYDSKYYDDLTILYFISRWYTGSLKKIIQKQVIKLRNIDSGWGNPLRDALAISILTAIGAPPEIFLDTVEKLANSMTRFEPIPFYIESIKAGKPKYAGSATLTASLCAEALSLFEQKYLSISPITIAPIVKPKENLLHEKIMSNVKSCIDQFPFEIKDYTNKILKRINSDKKITSLSYYFAKNSLALNDLSSEKIVDISVEIGTANVYGWLAYTIYDDILDNEISNLSFLLPIANVCFMKSVEIYENINNGNVKQLTKDFIINMEKANTQEKIRKQSCKILANKSMPYALGPISIFLIREKDPSPIINFFKHYLTAKQLNDDAHDWQDDLKTGFTNSVGSMLISEYFLENPKQSINNIENMNVLKLSEIFQNKVIDKVSRNISSEVSKARTHLAKISDRWDTSYFEEILKPLEQSAIRAITERDTISDFLKTYKKSAPVL